MSVIALDTNILLLDASLLTKLGAKIIVLPETVIDELDNKKTGFTEVSFQAREFGRLLSKAEFIGVEATQTTTVTAFSLDSTIIHVVALPSYPADLTNDRKIIHAVQAYSKIYGPTTLMSNDVMCRIRAMALGLPVTEYKVVEKTSYEFIKYLEVDFNTFSELHQKSVTSIDPDHLPENHNYIFTCPDSTQVKPAIILDNKIQIIGKTTEEELHRQDMAPINIEQLLLARAIQEPSIDIIVVEALSGSGKTVSALSNAIKLVKRNPIYNSITYIRNSVDDYGSVDEEVGFLSGNDEKMNVYLQPIWDALDTIVRKTFKGSNSKGKELEEKIDKKRDELTTECNIQAMIALGMRGRTLENSIVIIDEAQNIPQSTMQKLLTRIGKNCKVIIIGSLRQIDSKYLNKYTSGLSVILKACTDVSDTVTIHACTLSKVVRSHVADWAESLFTKDPK